MNGVVGRRTHPLQILGSCRFPASAKEYLPWRTAPGNPPATVSASFWRAISVRASRLWVFARARRPVARDAIGLFRSATAGDVPAFRGRRIGSRVALLPLWGLPAVSDRGGAPSLWDVATNAAASNRIDRSTVRGHRPASSLTSFGRPKTIRRPPDGWSIRATIRLTWTRPIALD